MARKKAEATVKVARTSHDRIVEDIIQEYGKVAISADDLLDREKLVVPASPSLDFAHNGGWQEGTFVVLVGPPRCGKTTTALHFAGKAQRPHHGGFNTVYLNAEARLERRDIRAIADIKTDREHFTIIQSSAPEEDEGGNIVRPGKILTARDFLDIAEKFLLNTVRRVIILDSVSAMVGESEQTNELGHGVIAEAQRLFSQFMRRNCQVIAVNKHIFVGVVHLYSNAGGGPGPKWLEKMPNSANYGLATKFRATHFDNWEVGGGKTVVGQVCHWKCERSPLGQPGIKVDSYIRYGSGIDEHQEIIKYGIDLKFIEQNGSHYYMNFADGRPSAHGESAMHAYFAENPDRMETLRGLVYEGLGLPT